MPKRSSKETEDVNEIAARVVREATDESRPKAKNRAAVALGRRGGKVGGKRRAAALSPERRKEIAQKAAKTRWGKPRRPG